MMTFVFAKAFLDAKENTQDQEILQMLTKVVREMVRMFPYAVYGSMFYTWLFDSQCLAYYGFGNGSAMRVSVVAWLYHDIEAVKHPAKLSAQVTHNHPQRIKGA